MATDDPVLAEVERLLAPILESTGTRLYDLERQGGLLKVTVDRDGGVDLEALSEVNRELGRALDEADPIPGSYTLEVSSPGLERSLRTEAHWATAVGERVKVKLRPDASEVRRLEGTIDEVDGGFATVIAADGTRSRFELARVDRAKTVFEWQAQPKPGSSKGSGSKGGGSKRRPAGRGPAGGEGAPEEADSDDEGTESTPVSTAQDRKDQR